jgi:hypothetical protein
MPNGKSQHEPGRVLTLDRRVGGITRRLRPKPVTLIRTV